MLAQHLQTAQSAAAAQQKTQNEAAELLASRYPIRSTDVFAARDQAEQAQEEAAARIREMEVELKLLQENTARARLQIQDLERERQAYQKVQPLAGELADEWQQTIASIVLAGCLLGFMEPTCMR